MAAAAEGSAPVTLHLYDLTQGMASMLSPMLLGKHIAGIWHTGIVVHGREYFFGYGISSTAAGRTPFGQPTMVVALGATEVPPGMVSELIADLRPRFRPQDYNLLKWNCNNFTSELSLLLTGEDIPEFVRTQAQEVMETPLGRQFAPLILQLEGITSQAHAAGFGAAPGPPEAASAAAAAAAAPAAAAAADVAAAPSAASPGASGGGSGAAGVSAAAAAGAAAAARAAQQAAGGGAGGGSNEKTEAAASVADGVAGLRLENGRVPDAASR